MKKILNLLGLAKRAGKIIVGEDLLVKALQNKTINLLIIAEDCGKNTTKKLTDKATYYNVKFVKVFTVEEISLAIGMDNRVAIGVTDNGFSKKIRQLLEEGGIVCGKN